MASSEQTTDFQDILTAVISKNTQKLTELLQHERCKHIFNNWDDQEHYTPLMWAAKFGYDDIVELLCDCTEVEIDKAGGWNETTAMMKAVMNRHISVVKVLIQNGASLNKKNSVHMTALMLAAQNPDKESAVIAQSLLQEPTTDVTQINIYRFTALILAAESGSTATMRHLLNHNQVDFEMQNHANQYGKTAFFMAAECGHVSILELIVARYRKDEKNLMTLVNKKSKAKKTALQIAAVKKHQEVVYYLLSLPGIDIDGAVEYACQGGDLMIMQELKGRAESEGKTMEWLESACKFGHGNIVRELVKEFDWKYINPRFEKCLSIACRNGHMDVVIALLDKVNNKLSEMHDTRSIIEATKLDEDGEDGSSALSLLANYCRQHKEKLIGGQSKNEALFDNGFLSKCVEHNANQPFLLDLLPYILPAAKSPNMIMNLQKEKMIVSLRGLFGRSADIQLVGALVNIAAALKKSALEHHEEFRDLESLSSDFEDVLVECMNSPSMDSPENVTKVLRRRDIDLDNELPEVVQKAYTIQSGPLHQCAENNLTKFFATAQIIRHVEEVFYSSLKPKPVDVVRSPVDLFQLRTECSTIRFRPCALFMFEGASKLLSLWIVYSILSATDVDGGCGCNAVKFCEMCSRSSDLVSIQSLESILKVLLVTSLCHEIGEILSKDSFNAPGVNWWSLHLVDWWSWQNSAKRTLVVWQYVTGQWNFIDCMTITAWSCWAVSAFGMGKVWLALSAIPLAFSLLRFLSIFKATGQLVIMIFEMVKDLAVFFIVFATFMLGFSIAFHGLLRHNTNSASAANETQKLHSFKSFWSTLFALFDAAVGNHDFELVGKGDKKVIGTLLLGTFIMFASVMLLNLIVARMSATHDKVSDRALEVWSKMQAVNVQDFALLKERSSLCMLPPPLNAISFGAHLIAAGFNYIDHSAAGSLVDGAHATLASRNNNGFAERVFSSLDSRVADWLTRCVIFSVPCAIAEVYWANESIWKSSVPREVPIAVTTISLLFLPIWIVLFWMMIMWSIFAAEEAIYVDAATRKIKFSAEPIPALKIDRRFLVPLYLMSCLLVNACITSTANSFRDYESNWVLKRLYCLVADSVHPNSVAGLFNNTSWYLQLLVAPCYLHSIPVLIYHLDPDLKHDPTVRKLWQCVWRACGLATESAGSATATSKWIDWWMWLRWCGCSVAYIGSGTALSVCACLLIPSIRDQHVMFVTGCHVALVVLSCWMYRVDSLVYDIMSNSTEHPQASVQQHAPVSTRQSPPSIEAAQPPPPPLGEETSPRMQMLKRQKSAILKTIPREAPRPEFGIITIDIIRATLECCGESYFGRKASPYVMMTLGGQSCITKPVLREESEININELKTLIRTGHDDNSILFEVYDKGDIDKENILHDKRLCWVNYSIKDWLSNQFFMGTINLCSDDGRQVSNTLQLNVKVAFPHTEPGGDIVVSPLEELGTQPVREAPELFTAKDRARMFKAIVAKHDIDAPQPPAAVNLSQVATPVSAPSSFQSRSISTEAQQQEPPLSFHEGTRVLGNYRGLGSWHPGTITCARVEGTYDIRYDNRDSEQRVDRPCIMLQGAGDLLEGSRVMANFHGSGAWYPGTIVCEHEDQTFDIEYDEDVELQVVAAHIRLL